MKKILILFSALALFGGLGVASALASTVTRSFDNPTPTPGSPVIVSLTAAADPIDVGGTLLIDETLPAGWVVSNAGTGDTSLAGHIRWLILPPPLGTGVASGVFNYTLTAPATLGVHTFSGEFAFDSTTPPLPQILGATTVDVQAAPVVPVLTSVIVSPVSAIINIGQTQQLVANPLDQNSAAFVGAIVTWSSSDPLMATVDANGLVSAVASGPATITATAVSGAVTVTDTSAITVATPVIGSSVTRSFSNANPTPGSPVIVSLTAAADPIDVGGTLLIDETLPAGWVVSNAGTGDTSLAGHIRWLILPPPLGTGVASGVFNYTLTAPATLGVHTFSGEFAFDSTTPPLPQILGANSVNVSVDTVAPVITITGANPLDITVGAVFTDPGATANDDREGDITARIVSTSTVNSAVVGAYTVDYSVSDLAGNVGTASRIVNVVAAPAPAPAPAPAAAGGGGGGGGGGSGLPASGTPFWLPGQGNTGGSSPVAVAPATPTAPAGQVLGAVAVRFELNLKQGDRGDDVIKLQEKLKLEGDFNGPVTGFFGPLTFEAVKKFQARKGIFNTGFVGPLTRGSLNSGQGSVAGASTGPGSGLTLSPEMESAIRAQIATLQAQLINLLNQVQELLKAGY